MNHELDFCNDGERHQWTKSPWRDREDGMICGGCGVSEAELDHLIRHANRRKRAAVTEDTQ